MGLFDLFRRKTAPAAARGTSAAPGRRRFHQDRSLMFDVGRTSVLAQLLAVPRGERDDAWTDRFFDAAWTGSIFIPPANSFTGPDGFRYYRLVLPRPGEPFDSHCLGALVPDCLAQQCGAAYFLSEEDPPEAAAYVCSLGLIDSLLRHDSPHGDPIDAAEAAEAQPEGAFDVERSGAAAQQLTVRKEHSVLLGSPSADFLPPALAAALHRFLTETWGMREPRVQIMVDMEMRPRRSLIVSRRRSEFPEGTDVDFCIRQLHWFLPPNRMVMLMPEEWDPAGMTPLRNLF